MGKGKVWKGLCLYIRYIWKEKKSIYLMGILFFPAYILSNYLQVYLPKMVIMELEEKRTITHFGISIMWLSFFLILCIFIKVKMLSRIKYSNRFINQRMQNEYSQKLLYVDYKYLEDQEFLTVRDKVKESLFGGSVGDEWERAKLADFMETLVTLAAVTGNVVLYAYHLCKLSYWMLAIFLIAPFIMVLTQKTVMKNERDNAVKASGVWQKLDYVIRKTEDFSMAKDVRMYQMDVWLSGLLEKLCKKRLEYKAKELKPRCALSVISTLVFGVYHAGLFAAILAGLWNGNINVADVVFYAGMGPALYFLMEEDFLNNIRRLFQLSVEFKRFREYTDYGENTGKTDIPVNRKTPVIEFQHVSFTYPGSDREVLKDINLVVEKGEKIAIVGVNGAGKTTLMKLTCGLLLPASGRILLDGKDMAQMEPEERYSWFSCAFQDIQFLPLSIKENISMLIEDADNLKIWDCLKQAGIKDEVGSLPLRLDTMMEKTLNKNAVDFSGGQKQKLILARALYRDTGVLVLDEPTAALDALAENDIYEKYARFTKDKTSFFVSHRLSSTRFCDRILLIDGGNIAEEGTHEELLAAGGLYAGMFEMQSKYYKECEA
ncbi:MAG: ABC transporter ATP-binding protein [Lachnospiraceae bacterium]|nr:ABC transporter ATP-binding protein [Lachnospiraceae bacterium]